MATMTIGNVDVTVKEHVRRGATKVLMQFSRTAGLTAARAEPIGPRLQLERRLDELPRHLLEPGNHVPFRPNSARTQ